MFETIIENLTKLPSDTIQTYLSDSHLLFLLEESLKISLPSSFLDGAFKNEQVGGRREERRHMMEEGGERRGVGGGKEERGAGNRVEEGQRKEEGGGGKKGIGFIVLTNDETLNNCFDLIKHRIFKVLRKVISLDSFKSWKFRRNEFDEFLKRVLVFMIDEIERYVAFENSNFKMREIEVWLREYLKVLIKFLN